MKANEARRDTEDRLGGRFGKSRKQNYDVGRARGHEAEAQGGGCKIEMTKKGRKRFKEESKGKEVGKFRKTKKRKKIEGGRNLLNTQKARQTTSNEARQKAEGMHKNLVEGDEQQHNQNQDREGQGRR